MNHLFEEYFIKYLGFGDVAPGLEMQSRVIGFGGLALISDAILLSVFGIRRMSTNEMKFVIALLGSLFVTPWIAVNLAWPPDQAVFDVALIGLLISPAIWLLPIMAVYYGVIIRRSDILSPNSNSRGLVIMIALQLVPFIVLYFLAKR